MLDDLMNSDTVYDDPEFRRRGSAGAGGSASPVDTPQDSVVTQGTHAQAGSSESEFPYSTCGWVPHSGRSHVQCPSAAPQGEAAHYDLLDAVNEPLQPRRPQ